MRTRDITLRQDNDYQHQVTFVDASDNGINVSAYTYAAYVTLDGTVAATFSINSASAASGIIVLSLTKVQTAALTAGARYLWHVEQTDAASKLTTPLLGNVTVLPDLRS